MGSAPWLSEEPLSEKKALRRSKPRKDDPLGADTRAVVRGRSGGVCEVGGCGQGATHIHHRQLRRFGDHTARNLLHVCSTCHVRIHGHVRYALDAGWIVSSYDDPALREVLRRDEWVWLGAGGELLHVPPPTEVPC